MPDTLTSPTCTSKHTIVEIRHWLIYVPFTETISWGSGKRPGSTRLVVEVTTAAGVHGYGETICLLDFVPTVLEKVVIPLTLGKQVSDIEKLHRHVEGAGYYHHKRAAVMALAAVEMAMWDALGKTAGLPLHQMWGGSYRQSIEMTAYLFISDPQKVKEAAQDFLEQGFNTFKIKIGLDEKSDVDLVRAVREAIGSHRPLRADVNGAWTVGSAKRILKKLEPYDLQYIEQPLMLEDLHGHRELREVQSTPVALDESAYTLSDVSNILQARAADVILLDPHEAGGLWQARKAAALAEAAGIPVTLHSGGELGLSQAAYLHLAASTPNMGLAIDTEHSFHAADILTEDLEFQQGHLQVPTLPGLGVQVDLDKLQQFGTDTVWGAYLDPDRPGWFAEKPKY